MVREERVVDVRLLVLDIDGTIADRSNRFRDSVAWAVDSARRRGVAIAIATGRSYQCAIPAYDFIGSNLPLICYEGALICEPNTGFVHRHWPLQPHVAAQMLDHTERLGLSSRLSINLHVQDTLYVSNLNDAAIEYFERSNLEPVVVNDLRQVLNRATTKVTVLSDDVHDIVRLFRQLKNSYGRIQVSHDKSLALLEAFHPAVNKRLALSYLVEEILSLRPENVMVIGDDFTDIEMIRYAGIGVAMADAPVAVRSSADWVTTTIERDGVARAIEKWILC